ncbi:unnamed protein product [Effrenium voratum]|nr:unnamed protein product [Effrenium voratum]CAJ1457025.1 unnamed protein product [Effrenium voratum]
MGCCEGKLPHPDDFLAPHTPRGGLPFLRCMPPSLRSPHTKYLATPWSVCLSQLDYDEGVGSHERIVVREMHSKAMVICLDLCPHRSFRKFSFIRDPQNELLGAMQTMQKIRPRESQRSHYALYGKQPVSGSQSITLEGQTLYHWATLTRPAFSFDAKMRMEGALKGDPAWTISMQLGLPPPRWVVRNRKGGAAVVPRSGDKKYHEYVIAPGVDPGLVVCGTFAQLLALDELRLSS